MTISVDFFTFCHSGDIGLLHQPDQLKKQVESHKFNFNSINVINQRVFPKAFSNINPNQYWISDNVHIDDILLDFGIDIDKPQYVSSVDKAHFWKYHVVNHIYAAQISKADYILFSDNDCWIVESLDKSWIEYGISILERNPNVYMVSPNDGEAARMTQRISQQIFLCRTKQFRESNLNQPNWDGDVNIPNGPMPEYWAMLEGRIELWLRHIDNHRYVLPEQYRYWHHNKIEDGKFVTDRSRY